MLDLFQKFIESLSNKDVAKETNMSEKDMEVCEQERKEIKMSQKEIAESSAQGAARGLSTNTAPYCYRYLAQGHPKEECTVTLLCDICESVAHVNG
jgi:hypothetical protein